MQRRSTGYRIHRHAGGDADHQVPPPAGHGAEVVLCGAARTREGRAAAGGADRRRSGSAVRPPRHHRGTGHHRPEIAEDLPAVDTVLVPVSGGWPGVRIGTAIKALCPDARVFGVEPELAADTPRAFAGQFGGLDDRGQEPDDCRRPASQPSELTFAHLQQVLDDVITVSENEIRAAVRELAYRAHLVANRVVRSRWRLSTGRNSAGSHGDDFVGRQHRTADAASDSGRLTQAATTGITKGTEISHFS